MEDDKNSSCVTFTNCTVSDSNIYTTMVSTNAVINYTVDTNSYIFVDTNGTVNYNDPYQELEATKQQQEKEEELRKENSCLQEAWNNYQLILKLLEENECDKFLEERYRTKK